MNFTRAFFILLLFLSCSDAKNTIEVNRVKGKTWNVHLDNHLGILKITLPPNLDTFFNWTQYSDCGDPCAKVNYRIQSKQLPIFKENGFYWYPLKDSVEQLTIKHPKLTIQWTNNDTSLIQQFSADLKNQTFENQSNKFLIDTMLKVDNLNIAVFALNSIDTTQNVKVQILHAATSFNGNLIELIFEYRKNFNYSDSSNFIQTSFNALQTIRIYNTN